MVHQNPSKFGETLFYAAISTSGLVTQFQRPKKAEIFGKVRQLVQDLKAGNVCTADMTVIQPHQIAQAPDPFDSQLLSFSVVPKIEESSDNGGEQTLDGLVAIQGSSREGQ